MVILLLLSVFCFSCISGLIVVVFMRRSLLTAYTEIFGAEVVSSWQRIISTLIIVTSLTGGFSFHILEKFLPTSESFRATTFDVIVLESLRALLNSAQSVIHVLLVLLIISVLVALVLRLKGVYPQQNKS